VVVALVAVAKWQSEGEEAVALLPGEYLALLDVHAARNENTAPLGLED
jgi:hypothetical protein